MRRFTADKVSVNKREVRDLLYDDVRELIPRVARFGMLPGHAPEEEIGCIRARFYRPQITAVDLDSDAIAAAAKCGVATVRGNACHEKTFDGLDVEFFNLDLCKQVISSKRVIQNVARHARLGMSVFVSFGLGSAEEVAQIDQVNSASTLETTNRAERATSRKTTNVVERATGSETTNEVERAERAEITMAIERATRVETTNECERTDKDESTKAAECMTDAQIGRVRLIHNIVCAVRPEAQIGRIYVYRGNQMMMLGALFVFTKQRVELRPMFHPTYEASSVERKRRLMLIGLGGKNLTERLNRGDRQARRKMK